MYNKVKHKMKNVNVWNNFTGYQEEGSNCQTGFSKLMSLERVIN